MSKTALMVRSRELSRSMKDACHETTPDITKCLERRQGLHPNPLNFIGGVNYRKS